MLEHTDTNMTLPSIVSNLQGNARAEELVLTLIFHPDTSRIGQRAVVPIRVPIRVPTSAPTKVPDQEPVASSAGSWVLGRRSPDFGRGEASAGAPLDDRYVSRKALQFDYRGGQLLVRRPAGASRCRVGTKELYDSVRLDQPQLRAGVPLLLGHSIVLLLRLQGSPAPLANTPVGEDLLRGSSVCMREVRERVGLAAACDLDVLIRGETGTGKELVATAIHRASGRSNGPMISVNMSAIPRELAPAALFGSARGAYTGADRAAPGYFEQAQGGSLFLDEVADTSLEVQPQLLRALQQREVQSVGGPVRRVDVRVISATDADIESQDCGFRAALRHRLGACEIRMPALREHPEDVGELLLFFLRESAAGQGRSALLPHANNPAVDIAAWSNLFFNFLSYHWPGNVRELANAAQQVVLASTTKAPIMTDCLRATLSELEERGADSGAAMRAEPPKHRKIQDIEEDQFEQAMVSSGFEPLRVARQLGVSRTSVYRRIEASGRYRLASQIPQDEVQQALEAHAGSSSAAATQLGVSHNSLRNRLRQLSLDWQ